MTMTNVQSNRTNVIVADPRIFLRGCLARWLDEPDGEFQPTLVSQVSNAFQADEPAPAAVILSTPPLPGGRNWLEEQIGWLRVNAPTLPTIMIMDDTGVAMPPGLAASFGVQGYIPMSTSLEVAAAALRLVIAGGCYFPQARVITTPPSVHAPQEKIAVEPSAPIPAHLTPREQSVLDLMAKGLPNKIIAYRLGLALGTVKIHVHHIIEKLKVQNRTEAVLLGRHTPSVDEAMAIPAAIQINNHSLAP
jgi:DNA-binding NarL/FixJ family response regulator